MWIVVFLVDKSSDGLNWLLDNKSSKRLSLFDTSGRLKESAGVVRDVLIRIYYLFTSNTLCKSIQFQLTTCTTKDFPSDWTVNS